MMTGTRKLQSKSSAHKVLIVVLVSLAIGGVQSTTLTGVMGSLDSPAYRMISDHDQAIWQQIKHHIASDFSEFKTVNEVNSFLEKVRVLVQKHPKNVAFAQGDLRDLHRFLSLEIIAKLIRVDNDLFQTTITDERMQLAQRAVEEDELTKRLYGGPFRQLVEARKQQLSRAEDGNHKDGNFFTSFWCKISGNCNNQ